MLRPVWARRQARLLLEDHAEVFDVRKAAALGDVGQRQIGLRRNDRSSLGVWGHCRSGLATRH